VQWPDQISENAKWSSNPVKWLPKGVSADHFRIAFLPECHGRHAIQGVRIPKEAARAGAR
jgi:hypothetical protein